MLAKIKPNTSVSYSYKNEEDEKDTFMFHHHNEGGFTYLCMTESGFKTRTAFAFLFYIKDKFTKKFGEQASQAIGLSANNQFSKELKERIVYFSTDPNIDTISEARANLNKTKDIMVENLEKILGRGHKIDFLVKKTVQMSDSAVQLRRTATTVRTHMWWKNFKMSLIICGILLVWTM